MAQPSGAPTVIDVAEHAGVSRQTVSNAINAPERVAEPTLQRVRDSIEALGYVPNRSARSLRTKTSRLFALRMERAPDGNVGPFRDRFLGALTSAAGSRDLQILLFSRGPDAGPMDGYREVLLSTGPDAFVLLDTHGGDPRPAALTEMGATFVAFGRPWEDDEATHPWLDVDGAAGTRQATRHLLRNGWRSIGFLGWPESPEAGEDRLRGWREVMEAVGLDASERHVGRSLDDFDLATGVAAELLDAGHDAIVCASDTLAAGVYRAAALRGLQVGVDVAVVGFDDSALVSMLHPNLTSVHQPLEQVAELVVDVLSDLVDGKPARRPRLLEPRLSVRASSARRPDPDP